MLIAATASAADATQLVREELEQELRALVQIPAARVVISYESLDEPNLVLEGAQFILDGRVVAGPEGSALSAPGEHPVWEGEVPEGSHELVARLTWVDSSSVMLSDQAGYRWKVSAAVRFETERGLEVKVRTVPERDSSQEDLRKQMRVAFRQGITMLAKVDTTVPPPLERPKRVAVAEAEPPEVSQPRPATAPRDEYRPSRKKKRRTAHHREYRKHKAKTVQVAEARDVRPAASRKAEKPKVEPAVGKAGAEAGEGVRPAGAGEVAGAGGANGVAGANGTTEAAGVNGVAAANAAAGTTGLAGVNAAAGADGAGGANGVEGAAAAAGANGAGGANGAAGVAEANGAGEFGEPDAGAGAGAGAGQAAQAPSAVAEVPQSAEAADTGSSAMAEETSGGFPVIPVAAGAGIVVLLGAVVVLRRRR